MNGEIELTTCATAWCVETRQLVPVQECRLAVNQHGSRHDWTRRCVNVKMVVIIIIIKS